MGGLVRGLVRGSTGVASGTASVGLSAVPVVVVFFRVGGSAVTGNCLRRRVRGGILDREREKQRRRR